MHPLQPRRECSKGAGTDGGRKIASADPGKPEVLCQPPWDPESVEEVFHIILAQPKLTPLRDSQVPERGRAAVVPTGRSPEVLVRPSGIKNKPELPALLVNEKAAHLNFDLRRKLDHSTFVQFADKGKILLRGVLKAGIVVAVRDSGLQLSLQLFFRKQHAGV